MPERASSASELKRRAREIAERAAQHPIEHEAERRWDPLPSREPQGGYIDLVFMHGAYVCIEDARGRRIEVGTWHEISEEETRLRIPWQSSLGDPSKNGAGKSHRGGRATEVSSAQLVTPRSGTQRAIVLAAFQSDCRNGGDGMIDEELSTRTKLNHYSAAPRRLELVESGWLRDSGRVRRTKHSADAIVWELTDAAKRKLGLIRD